MLGSRGYVNVMAAAGGGLEATCDSAGANRTAALPFLFSWPPLAIVCRAHCSSRWRDFHSAASSSPFSRCFNRDGEGM